MEWTRGLSFMFFTVYNRYAPGVKFTATFLSREISILRDEM